jgi:hypothetical protein
MKNTAPPTGVKLRIQAQMAALEAKVEPVAKQALFFRLMPR